TLVELNDPPDPADNVFWAGWDRSGATPPGTATIHHPNCDEKALALNYDPPTTTDNCIGSGANTHWNVATYEVGTTEFGSSGSALFDSSTRRIVGTLSGGG